MVGSASGASWVRERLNGDGRMLSLMWLPTYRLYVVASDGDRPRYAVDLARALEAVTGVAPDEEWVRRVERRLGRLVWRVPNDRGDLFTIDYDSRTALWTVVAAGSQEEHVSASLSAALATASGEDPNAPWIADLKSRISRAVISLARAS